MIPWAAPLSYRVYPPVGIGCILVRGTGRRTRFLCACTNVRRHPSYQERGDPSILSRSRSFAPREAFISAYDSSNSAPGLTTAEEFKMATFPCRLGRTSFLRVTTYPSLPRLDISIGCSAVTRVMGIYAESSVSITRLNSHARHGKRFLSRLMLQELYFFFFFLQHEYTFRRGKRLNLVVILANCDKLIFLYQ